MRTNFDLSSLLLYFELEPIHQTKHYFEFSGTVSHVLVFRNSFEELILFDLKEFQLVTIEQLFIANSHSDHPDALEESFNAYSSFISNTATFSFSVLVHTTIDVVISSFFGTRTFESIEAPSVNLPDTAFDAIKFGHYVDKLFATRRASFQDSFFRDILTDFHPKAKHLLSYFNRSKSTDGFPLGVTAFDSNAVHLIGNNAFRLISITESKQLDLYLSPLSLFCSYEQKSLNCIGILVRFKIPHVLSLLAIYPLNQITVLLREDSLGDWARALEFYCSLLFVQGIHLNVVEQSSSFVLIIPSSSIVSFVPAIDFDNKLKVLMLKYTYVDFKNSKLPAALVDTFANYNFVNVSSNYVMLDQHKYRVWRVECFSSISIYKDFFTLLNDVFPLKLSIRFI